MTTRRTRRSYRLEGEPVTLAQLAETTGLHENTVHRRLLAGESPEEVVANPNPDRGKLSLNGRPTTVKAVAALARISRVAVLNRLRAGMSPEEVVALGATRVRDLSRVVRLHGRVLSLRELGTRCGLTVGYVRRHLDAGMTPEQLVDRQHRKTYTLFGERLSVAEIASLCGLSGNLVRARLAQGWSAERIVTTPRKAHKKTIPTRRTLHGKRVTLKHLRELTTLSIPTLIKRLRTMTVEELVDSHATR